MIRLYDIVRLKRDMPEIGVYKGQRGNVIEVYDGGRAFEIDFVVDEESVDLPCPFFSVAAEDL